MCREAGGGQVPRSKKGVFLDRESWSVHYGVSMEIIGSRQEGGLPEHTKKR
jgi:hypothetical protein